MPVESWDKALSESTVDVLEKMFFTVPVEAEDAGCDPEPALSARLRFRGSPSGALVMHISALSARSLASNFFGVDPDEISAAQIEEVVGELANMLCGCLLSR